MRFRFEGAALHRRGNTVTDTGRMCLIFMRFCSHFFCDALLFIASNVIFIMKQERNHQVCYLWRYIENR